MHFKVLLKWALRLSGTILGTPLIKFEIKVSDPEMGKLISNGLADGKIDDNEFGRLLRHIAKGI